MRNNEFGELMRIKEIQLQPEDFENPTGDWNERILWATQHEKTLAWYGEIIESVSMAEAVKRGVISKEEYGQVYSVLAKVADQYYKSETVENILTELELK